MNSSITANVHDLPCFSGLSVQLSPIKQGLSHQCFLAKVIVDDSINAQRREPICYFIKCFVDHQATASKENQFAELFAKQGISPKVIYTDERYLVTEFIAGKPLSDLTLNVADKISACITLMDRLHQLPLAPTTDTLSMYDELVKLVNQSHVNLEQRTGLLKLCHKVSNFQVLAPIVQCHGDINFTNVLRDKLNNDWLVDFESACLAPREYELAMFIAINCLSNHQAEMTIESYQVQTGKSLNMTLLEHYLPCCYLLNGLWFWQQRAISKKLTELANAQFERFDRINPTQCSINRILSG